MAGVCKVEVVCQGVCTGSSRCPHVEQWLMSAGVCVQVCVFRQKLCVSVCVYKGRCVSAVEGCVCRMQQPSAGAMWGAVEWVCWLEPCMCTGPQQSGLPTGVSLQGSSAAGHQPLHHGAAAHRELRQNLAGPPALLDPHAGCRVLPAAVRWVLGGGCGPWPAGVCYCPRAPLYPGAAPPLTLIPPLRGAGLPPWDTGVQVPCCHSSSGSCRAYILGMWPAPA